MKTPKDKPQRITPGDSASTATAPKAAKAEAKAARVVEGKAEMQITKTAREKTQLKGRLKDTLPAEAERTGSGQQNDLDLADWNFSELDKLAESEFIACCFYEYARESPSILAHYNEGKKIESFPGSMYYHAQVDKRLQTFPNPFVWPWSREILGPFLSKPWLTMDAGWRAKIREKYEGNQFLSTVLPPAFRLGDSPWMKRDILSRGVDRSGIHHETGEERIVVEIDWASRTDTEIVESFEKWVKANRPSGIGRHSEKGRRKENSWFRKLDNLAIMRLLHHAPLSEWEKAFPDAWKRYGPKVRKMDLEDYADSKNRELYKRRQSALDDFHALFPFLPASEHPVSWETKAKR